MKKIITFYFLFLFLLTYSISIAGDFRSGRTVKIDEKDTIHSDLYAASQYANIYGIAKGDIWIACQSITIQNHTMGSLFAAAQSVDVDGKIDGGALLLGSSVKFRGHSGGGLKIAGAVITIDGKIDRDVIVAGGQVFIDRDAVINGDLIIAGGEVVLDGTVKGNMTGTAQRIFISGKIGKDVKIEVNENLVLQPGCSIGGDFHYKAENEFDVKKENVKGSINYEKLVHKKWNLEKFGNLFRLFTLVAALICAFIILPFTKHKLKDTFKKLDTSNWQVLGIGFLGLIVTPIVTLILIALIVTIPVAMILGFLYLIFLYLGKIFAGIYIGEKLLFLINKKEPNIYLSALAGIVVLYVVFFIPYFGILLYIVALGYGFGIMMKFLASLFSKKEVEVKEG